MRKKPLMLLIGIVCICLALGVIYGAESIIYGDTDDGISQEQENVTLNITNNTTIDNTTINNTTINSTTSNSLANFTVKKHTSSQGFLHKIIRHYDPFDNVKWSTMDGYTYKIYGNSLWFKLSDGDYQLAIFNRNNEICDIRTNNPKIIDWIYKHFKVSSDCTQYSIPHLLLANTVHNDTNNTNITNNTTDINDTNITDNTTNTSDTNIDDVDSHDDHTYKKDDYEVSSNSTN